MVDYNEYLPEGLTVRTVVDGRLRYCVPPNSPCPCESGKTYISCHGQGVAVLRNPVLWIKPANTSPTPPQTQSAVPGCYAAELNDCSGALTLEHPVSESFWKAIPYGYRGMSGLPWGGPNVKPESIKSHVLCKRHNNALSDVDAKATQLFRACAPPDLPARGQQELVAFSGNDLERWLLKILCGSIASRALRFEGETDVTIPKQWLDVLFGRSEFRPGQGLYILAKNEPLYAVPDGIGLTPLANTADKRLVGLGMQIFGMELILWMSKFAEVVNGRRVGYRPDEFLITAPNFERTVSFSWTGPTSNVQTKRFDILSVTRKPDDG